VEFAVGANATGYFTVENSAFADDGVATVGDVTVGNISAVVGQSGEFQIYYIGNYATGTGDVVTGRVSVGNRTIQVATEGFYSEEIYNSGSGSGDTLVGDLVIGDLVLNMGVNSSAEIYHSAYADGTGDIAIGDVTIGDMVVDANDGGYLSYSLSVSSYGDVGDITIGDISLQGGVSSTIYLYHSISVSGDVGDIRVGDISVTMKQEGYFTGSFSVEANDGKIGDVTFGDISLAAASGATIEYSVELEGETAVGDVTFGNIAIAAAGLNASASVSITIENDGAGSIGAMTFGDVSLGVNGENAYGYFYASASSAASIGTMTFGDFDLSITSGAKKTGAELYVDISNSVSDVVIGDISLAGGARAVGDNTLTYFASFSVDAGGDITVGDITVSGGDGLSDNFALLDFGLGWLDLGAGGKVTVGNIDYSGYGAAATIDVSGVNGAASIIGTAKGDTIYDNKGNNALTGGAGADLFGFTNDNTGKTLATLDKILDFSNSGGDKIDLALSGGPLDVNRYAESSFASFDAFVAGANTGDRAVYVGSITGVDGVVAAIDYNEDSTVDFMIQLVGVGLDGVDVASFV
jgi:hypothetical protein